jgi:hypothetical protein
VQCLQQGKQLTKMQIQQTLFPLPENSMQWGPLLPKEGGLIQVDIGGHPHFPIGSKQFSNNFGNLLFLAIFYFRGHFEGLNEGFLGSSFSMIVEGFD